MTERLVLSPTVGLFEPVPGLKGYLPGGDRSAERSSEAINVEVGGLLGYVGGTEVRSAFSGTLEGVLVLAGERVTRGQPVAWLRAPVQRPEARAGDRPGASEGPGAIAELMEGAADNERTA